ncbi:PPOX class F420-dependent oxidoreductase [Segniliparus rugosus]|uniref:Pyridoxamine 5'-phosphate oxidase N-terminal domain-containing protein n=1 Tax=Segniliparus rugosus (strain ATCC BAA-974 / DSM 45345 / CCUG 50838 / CIP 108380 / JCM 13579 / CDC 945) TaxID=679197 RepID=E5XPQ3_SEGRC|nr:PPOX class F420-dependent oxidoreductase [Segniliparus rugosus]EFV13651.1 hypothetical protein HMPREF9336_01475 [Segniliparus rugosus ATCC BAA-974]
MFHIDARAVEFLAAEPALIGQLGYIGRDGGPVVTPVWYRFLDNRLEFVTQLGTAKIAALRQEPRAAVTVASQTEPYGYVQVQGTVQIDPEPDATHAALIEIAARYLGRERAAAYVREHHSAPGEAIVRLSPARVRAMLPA